MERLRYVFKDDHAPLQPLLLAFTPCPANLGTNKILNPFLHQLTRLTTDVTFTTAAIPQDGFPTVVDLKYTSDFGTANLADPSGNEVLWLESKIKSVSSGVAHYTAADTLLTNVFDTADDDTTFSVTLGRLTSDPPAVGDYTVIVEVFLKYRDASSATWTMDNVVYTINVAVTGSASSTTVASAADVLVGTDSTNVAAGADITADGIRATPPTSLAVVQSAGGDAAGASVTLTVSMANALDQGAYWLWALNTDAVQFSTASDMSVTPYEWPDTLVAPTVTTQAGNANTFDIVLSAVPKEVYDWGVGGITVYAQVTVNYYDHSNDVRRHLALRTLQGTDGAPNQDGSINMVAEVQFGSDDSGATIITSFMVVSATALSGAALLL